MSETIAFTVYGKAEPAGSKRGFAFKRKSTGKMGVAISDANPKSRDWKNQVTWRAREFYQGELLDGPLAVAIKFHIPRPKGHFGKKGLKASAPEHHTGRPDVLKLARAVEDSLSSVIYRDDSQIVTESLYKVYGEPARCEITITPLPS